MPRRWRGVLTLENTQTGDGRVFAPGAIEWADLPLPLAWMADGDSLHLDVAMATPQVGTIETITREGDGIIGEGELYDTTLEGAEVIRRMDAGEAPLGNRFPVSIDPDNWDVEIIATDAAESEDILLIAAGSGPITRQAVTAAILRAVAAAAGDPDPGEGGGEGGMLLFEDSVDEILERYTRLRIRGATLCAIAAFDGAAIELVADSAAVPADQVVADAEAVVAHAAEALPIPTRPPAEWFSVAEPESGDERLVEQIDGSWAVPFTILDTGEVFGHVARRMQSHRGYATHVPPPTSRTGYREFHVGQVVCDDGTSVSTGALVVGCDHAPDSMTAGEARDHYANSGLGFADGRMVDGRFGPWFCGALRPGLTEDDLRVLRALSPSGDWRGVGGNLEMVSVLAVNTPGFPVAREALAAAASIPAIADATPPRLRMGEAGPVSLVAAAMVTRCSECAERAREHERLTAALSLQDEVIGELRAMRQGLARIERRTRHLEPLAASAIAERVHVNGR